MLTNFQLEDLCRYYNVPLTGVVMKNELPNKVQDGNWIVNLESAPDSGSHWFPLTINGKEAFVLDSFGAPPVLEIEKYVKRRKGCHLGYNNQIIQDISSSNCGFYSFCFLLYLKNHLKNHKSIYGCADEYISQYVNDTKKNDYILSKILLDNIPKNKTIHTQIKRLLNEKKVKDGY